MDGPPRDDLLPLTGRRIAIDQTPLPTTPLARAADLADNAKKHKVHNVDYSQGRWSWNKIRKANGGSTDGPGDGKIVPKEKSA